MVSIIIQELFAIQMLIKDLLSGIVSPLVVTWFLGKARNKVLWRNLLQKQSIELWPQPLVNLFSLSNCSESYNFEMSLKLHLYVIIKSHFMSVLTLFFMRGPNTLRLTVISFEKRLYLETSRLSLLNQMIS